MLGKNEALKRLQSIEEKYECEGNSHYRLGSREAFNTQTILLVELLLEIRDLLQKMVV
jgi:hypothetical protein